MFVFEYICLYIRLVNEIKLKYIIKFKSKKEFIEFVKLLDVKYSIWQICFLYLKYKISYVFDFL